MIVRPTAADLIVEVDIAAENIKELADNPNTDEIADQIAQHAIRGFAALAQLAARVLA